MSPKALLLILLIGGGLLQPYLNTFDIKLHEDPNRARMDVDPLFLLQLYIMVFEAIIDPGRYNLTELIRLSETMDVPDDLMFILNRLNSLISRLDDEINRTRYHIEEARIYINYKNYDLALEEVYRARYWLAHANITLNEIIIAVNELFRMVGRYGRIDERVRMAMGELKELQEQIEDLLLFLLNLLEEIATEAELGLELYYNGD